IQSIYKRDFSDVVYKRGEQQFHVGDKVICIENSPENQIFNGDMGIIKDLQMGVKTLKYATIAFGDRLVKLSNIDFALIKLAYACTIHKTQGSEFNNIIVVIDPTNNANNFMLTKKLLYTAITRAKDNLFIFADKEHFAKYAQKESLERFTSLKDKIKQLDNLIK